MAMTISKCCCCCSLRRGTIIIALFILVSSICVCKLAVAAVYTVNWHRVQLTRSRWNATQILLAANHTCVVSQAPICYFVLNEIIRWKYLRVLRGLIIQTSELSDASVNGADLPFFLAPSQNFKNRLLASSRLIVCPSVRMDQLRSQWTNFYKLLYFNVFRKSVEKIQVSFNYDKNNGHFTWSPVISYDSISQNST
jgi:hypothetical protein